MLLFVVSAVFAVLALAGIALVFTQGQFATVDGLFFTGILALIAIVFGANAAYEFRAWRSRGAGATSAADNKSATPSAKSTAAATAASAKPVASAGAASAAAQPAAEKPVAAVSPIEKPVAQAQPEPKPVVAPALQPSPAPKPAPAPKPGPAEDQFPLAPGAMLVREGIELPPTIAVSGQAFVPGWMLVERTDAAKIKRAIEHAGWHMIYLAPEPEAAAWGTTREQAEKRAMQQLLAEVGRHNGFEITRRRTRNRFGIFHVTFAGHARQVQKSPFLFERPAPARPLFSVEMARSDREQEVRAA